MSNGIVGGRLVIYCLKTIFANQFRAFRQTKSKRFAKRVVDPVLRCSNGRRRRLILNASERVACYHGKSRKPVIGDRKNITRVEVRSAHVFRANIRLKIRLGLVSGVNVSTEGKSCREVMCERQSDGAVLIVRAHIEKLGKASDCNQTEF